MPRLILPRQQFLLVDVLTVAYYAYCFTHYLEHTMIKSTLYKIYETNAFVTAKRLLRAVKTLDIAETITANYYTENPADYVVTDDKETVITVCFTDETLRLHQAARFTGFQSRG